MKTAQHRYVASHRYDYYAIDDYVGANPVRTVAIGLTKIKASIIADALNGAFENGRQFGHAEAEEEEVVEGYTNYPTFVISEWINDDHQVQDYYMGMAKALIMTKQDISTFANCLKENIEANLAGEAEPPYNDLVGYAISSANWYELTEEIWNKAKESNLCLIHTGETVSMAGQEQGVTEIQEETSDCKHNI